MKPSKLIIVGSGLVARQAFSIAALAEIGWAIHAEVLAPEQIWRTDLDYLVGANPETTHVFAAIGPEALNYARFDLWAKLRLAGFTCARLIHPTAWVDATAHVGGNCLIAAHSSVGPDGKIGEGCILNAGARVEAGASIDPFCWIGANASIGEGAEVGSHSVFGAGVHLVNGLTIGSHCEVTAPGCYERPLADGTFVSSLFQLPVRICGG